MKKFLVYLLFGMLVVLSTQACAKEEDKSQKAGSIRDFSTKNVKDTVFVVETDEESASESLDRISGKIDLGFSAPDQSFKASDQYAPGPFGRQNVATSDE